MSKNSCKNNSKIDTIEEITKFNPYHGVDGRFTSGGGGSGAFLDDDDPFTSGGGLFFDEIEEVPPKSSEKKPKTPSKQEIKTEIEGLNKEKNLEIVVSESKMVDPNGTIMAEIYGTLPGGKEMLFQDKTPIKTTEDINRFKEIYAKAKKELDRYHAIGYRGAKK